MKNIIDLFKMDNKKDFAIELKRSEEFYKTAQKLSDYIKKLPLSNDENDTLVSIILEHVTTAEKAHLRRALTWQWTSQNPVKKNPTKSQNNDNELPLL